MSEKKSLSKEDWEFVKKQLDSGTYGRVELLADGFEVSFMRGLVSKNTIGIMTYVNGVFKMGWCSSLNGGPSEEARRFFRTAKKSIQVVRGKEREKYIRKWGKRALKELDARLSITYKTPVWGSFKALRAHLVKENVSLELVKPPSLLTEVTAETGIKSENT